ncbi:MAG: FtsX-like permease family protein [Clostridiales bacterium]|nr:FtsX-like permease family protein [Clostridiales bacterium]
MRKAFTKDVTKNITKQKVSFLSVLIIALIGVTVYLGIEYATKALKLNGSEFYNNANFRDIEIVATHLLSEEDLETLRKTEGVTDVEGIRVLTAAAAFTGGKTNVTVVSLSDRINMTNMVTGALPSDSNECAVEKLIAEENGWKVGDELVIEFSEDEKDNAKYLKQTRFVITGIVIHPDHINTNVPGADYVLVKPEVFDGEALDGCYMKAEIVVDKPAGINRFTNDYESLVSGIYDRIEKLSAERTPLRDSTVRNTYQKEIDKNQAKLDDAKKQIEDGEKALSDGEKELADGKTELDKAAVDLDNGWKKLEDAKKQLDDAKKDIDAGQQELDKNRKKLEDAKKQLDKAKKELTSGWNKIEDNKASIRKKIKGVIDKLIGEDSSKYIKWASRKKLNLNNRKQTATEFYLTTNFKVDLSKTLENRIAAFYNSSKFPKKLLRAIYRQQQIDAGVDPGNIPEPTSADLQKVRDYLTKETRKLLPSIADKYDYLVKNLKKWDSGRNQYLKGLKEYKNGLAKFKAGEKKFNQGKEKYNKGLKEYQSGLTKYNEGKEKYEKGLADYNEGLKTLNEKKAELQKGKAEYEDGVAKLNDARRQLEKTRLSKWIILKGSGNAGFVQLQLGSAALGDLEGTFATMFLALAILVIYATVCKMIDEQRTQVGTVKALGFFVREVSVKYIAFGLSATMMGIIGGILVAWLALEPYILQSYSIYYIFVIRTYILFPPTVIVIITGIVMSVATVLFAVTKTLKVPATVLLKPAAPQGRMKQKKKSGKLPLFLRVIPLNMKMDIKRVIVTIASIMGCCALIVVGFSLKDSVSGAVVSQYSKVIKYDKVIRFDTDDEDSKKEIVTALKNAGAEYTEVMETSITYTVTELQMATLVVGDLNEIAGMRELTDWKTGKTVSITDDGIYIHRRAAEIYNLTEGSKISIAIDGIYTADFTVAGIFDNHIGQLMILSPECLRTHFDDLEYKPDTMYVRTSGGNKTTLEDSLKKIKGVNEIKDSDTDRKIIEASNSAVDTVTMIMIAMAAVMAGVVLLNLTNVYIMEKKAEMSIMRINGYTVKEVIWYVSLETIATTIIGIILGVILGCAVSYKIIREVEQPFIMYVRSTSLKAILMGIFVALVFEFIVNVIALRKVRKLKLTDMTQ